MDTIPINELVSVFGSSALFLVASLLVWRRYTNVADRYLTYLEKENEAYRNSFQLGGVISPLRPSAQAGTSSGSGSSNTSSPMTVVNGSAARVSSSAASAKLG
jgi:hypothetical protein